MTNPKWKSDKEASERRRQRALRGPVPRSAAGVLRGLQAQLENTEHELGRAERLAHRHLGELIAKLERTARAAAARKSRSRSQVTLPFVSLPAESDTPAGADSWRASKRTPDSVTLSRRGRR